ncbi:hypothetical protein SLS60_007067 [Paraconiothyrium brasiliense]|uniref:Heterokaryon incompatibility domain-containing protein n=1 Tax=Paraconiothyrium brasiliense TaxID=300254 RepID=A0ABR3R8A4_9PLEO
MASSSKEQVANTAAENSSTKEPKPIQVLSQEEIADGFGMKRLGDYYEETSEREIVDLVLKSLSSGPNAAMSLAAREFNQSRRRTYQRCVKEVDFGSPEFCMNCEVAKKRRKELLNEAESSKSSGKGSTKPVTTEGGIDEMGELFLEHGKLEITGNLDLAFWTLRQEEAVLTIWVDAVCINQEDLGEKANQVARMDEIYKTADSVMAWLGPASETSSAALDFMDILAELSRSPEYDEDIRPHPIILEPTNFRIDPDVASEINATRVETNVDEVLERLWFSRMWVV